MNTPLLLVGPTASGKTALAVRIAKTIHGELVSADSRQIYTYMDIGTGKDVPTGAPIAGNAIHVSYGQKPYTLQAYEKEGIPVWMINVVAPDEEFSVAHFRMMASAVIDDILHRGLTPIIVGGTGFYVRSLIGSLDTVEIPPDAAFRARAESMPLWALQELLKRENPVMWDHMNGSDRANPRRLIRKLEITRARSSGPAEEKGIPYDMHSLGLTAPFPFLYKRIDARVEARMKAGMLGEIRELLERGYSWNNPSFNALGYRQWRDWFDHPEKRTDSLLRETVDRWKFDEHAYARRQMTWFKKQKGIIWIDCSLPGAEDKAYTRAVAWYNEKTV